MRTMVVLTSKLLLSSTGSGTTTSWTLLDVPIGSKCLAALVGVGQARLRKAASGTPDLRYGQRVHHFKPGSFTADAFFQVSYDSIAETLPDQFHAISLAIICFILVTWLQREII